MRPKEPTPNPTTRTAAQTLNAIRRARRSGRAFTLADYLQDEGFLRLREPAVDPVSFRRQACDVELGECGDHLADGEPRLAHELVRRRRQEVEDWIVCPCAIIGCGFDSQRFEDVGRRSQWCRAEPQE